MRCTHPLLLPSYSPLTPLLLLPFSPLFFVRDEKWRIRSGMDYEIYLGAVGRVVQKMKLRPNMRVWGAPAEVL